MLAGNLYSLEDAGKDFSAGCKGHFFIMDNLEEKGLPTIEHKAEIYNSVYSYTTVVVRGTLHMRINGYDIDVKADEIITITPCMSVEILESHCTYFCMLTLNHIVTDIYDQSGAGSGIKVRAFTFYHRSFDKDTTEELVKHYNIYKREFKRPDYPQKEGSIRALLTAFVIKFDCHRPSMTDITHFNDDSRQQQFFSRFLEFLSIYCKSERSVQFYADKLHITPKYLSNITNVFTRHSSSVVIDHYVIYNIQQTLYVNECNIKKVSEQYHFPSQSFFGRYFKRITGISPNAYVRLINKA